MNITICGLDELQPFIGKATHVISIIDLDDAENLPRMDVAPGNHLVICCDDVHSEAEATSREAIMPGSTCTPPTKAMVRSALTFAKNLPPDHFLLVHCRAGISRSTALAYAIMCQDQIGSIEDDVLQQVLNIRREASPNRLIVKYADQLLARSGRMAKAVKRLYG